MNKPLFGGKWGDSLPCYRCHAPMGVLIVCPKCGAKQPDKRTEPTDHIANAGKVIEPPKLRRAGSFGE